MKVSLGRDGWYLCDSTDQPDFAYEEFPAGAELAAHWLSQFRSDFYALAGLRRLFSDALYSDDEVVGQVASRLACGGWKARRRLPERIVTAPILGAAIAPSFPLEERRRAASPASGPAGDSPAFPADADLLVIAAAQKQAAAEGIPFCEECLKAQLAAGR